MSEGLPNCISATGWRRRPTPELFRNLQPFVWPRIPSTGGMTLAVNQEKRRKIGQLETSGPTLAKRREYHCQPTSSRVPRQPKTAATSNGTADEKSGESGD